MDPFGRLFILPPVKYSLSQAATRKATMMRTVQLMVTCVALLVATAGQVQAGTITFGVFGANTANASSIVTSQGHTAIILPDLSASSLAGIDALWALNGSNNIQLPQLGTFGTEVSSFVSGGGVFLYHDRRVTDAESVLPGGGTSVLFEIFSMMRTLTFWTTARWLRTVQVVL